MENRGPEDADLSLNIEALSTEMIYHLASTTLTKSIFKMNHRNKQKIKQNIKTHQFRILEAPKENIPDLE